MLRQIPVMEQLGELPEYALPVELRDTYAMRDPQGLEKGLPPEERGIDLSELYWSHHQ